MKIPRRTQLLSTALAVSLLTMGASAADSAAASTTALPNLSTATETTNTGKTSATGTNTNTGSAKTTATGSGTTSKVVISGSGSTGTNTASIPSISGTGTSGSDTGLPTNLPTLTGAVTIVTPSVPPTQDAPFMQQSNLPEGTVFIAVGAILGFMAMSVLLWRGLVAWSLHRSVKRAALAQHTAMNDTKAHFRTPGPTPGPPPPQFYKYSDRDSTISLGGLGHKSGKKGNRPSTAGGGASTSNLFFSPTASAAGAGLSTAGNRGSNYLPAGYYAAGSAQAGNGSPHVPLGHQPAISLSNLGPHSHGYSRSRSMGPSPPESPAGTTDRGYMASSSTLNLNQAYGGQERAPSAYLEDLFDGENGPPVPGHNANTNSGSPHRY